MAAAPTFDLITPVWPNRSHGRKPDLTFIRGGRLKGGRPDEGWLTTAPELVVQVVSAKDRVEDLELKLDHYREIGVPLIWVIHPGTGRAQVLGANRPRRERDQDGVLDGEETLPGFTCALRDLFDAAKPEE